VTRGRGVEGLAGSRKVVAGGHFDAGPAACPLEVDCAVGLKVGSALQSGAGSLRALPLASTTGHTLEACDITKRGLAEVPEPP
jgi:hypothetical protein